MQNTIYDEKRGVNLEQYQAWAAALDMSQKKYRAKLVKLAHGQTEVSVTPYIPPVLKDYNPIPWQDRLPRFRTDEEEAERDEENRKRSSKRARQNVRYYTKAMLADHMLTFSYRENVIDRVQVAKQWKEFVRLFRIRHPDWSYVAVLEKQERGSLHIHVAVQGRQDIRWLLRCWLIAIGQPLEDVSQWLVGGVKLAERSLGAVNVEPPKKRWGGGQSHWKRDKLASYLTKYIGKEFEESEKNAKKYWHSNNMAKPEITRFWLRAQTMDEAVLEARDLIFYTGADSLSCWGEWDAGVLWFTGETRRENIGKVTQCAPDFEMFED
ncbi:MAG: hypothetical protein HOO97_10105 [Sideroxydans sp.]|nr:hypothetical protein [Sideroxydans sp.]